MDTAIRIFCAAGAFVCSGLFWWLVFKMELNLRSPLTLLNETFGSKGDSGASFLLLAMLGTLSYFCFAFLERAFYG